MKLPHNHRAKATPLARLSIKPAISNHLGNQAIKLQLRRRRGGKANFIHQRSLGLGRTRERTGGTGGRPETRDTCALLTKTWMTAQMGAETSHYKPESSLSLQPAASAKSTHSEEKQNNNKEKKNQTRHKTSTTTTTFGQLPVRVGNKYE